MHNELIVGFWRRLKAFFRLNLDDVCEMSKGERDYPDYPDSTTPEPWHFHKHTCSRCGKKFWV